MVIHLSTLLQYYKRPDIQQALVDGAADKEIAVSFGGQGYGKRPDTLQYPNDILEHVKRGATSFHCSEELWLNPMQIQTGMPRQELDALRKGWDLLLDIDCPELSYSQIAGDLLVQALKHHGINYVTVKFSGNHGFHIGVPFEAFPDNVNGKPIKDWFPDGPRKIAAYLANMIRDELAKQLLAFHDIGTIQTRAKKTREELFKNGQFDPFGVLTIDTVLIAPRHLYRMPYSFNEKSGLISIPIAPERIMAFSKAEAHPDVVKPTMKYMERHLAKAGEAKQLFVASLDFGIDKKQREDYQQIVADSKKIRGMTFVGGKEFEIPQVALAETLFPPCIKLASLGMKDGKKRALFAITNFLLSVGWDPDKILEWLREWNKRNPEPLRDNIIEGHIRYHKQTKKAMLPPNCRTFWEELGICKPDNLCNRIKNPVSYATRRAWIVNQQMEEQRLEAEKEARKAEKLSKLTEKEEKKKSVSQLTPSNPVAQPTNEKP